GLPRPLAWRLRARGLLGPDGGLTEAGRRAAAAAARNEALWERFMSRYPELAPSGVAFGIAPIEEVLPADLVAELRAAGPA
ncbi:MAG TPA: hypothetical protein VFG47_08540, partial [Geminicoccaceae bacterium]|nr:hypothetical protein [Geminicoccaceae bacterium]